MIPARGLLDIVPAIGTARLLALLLSSVKPDRSVGTFGRMWWFSEPKFFETILPGRSIPHGARIRDCFDLPTLDKSRPKRNGNEPRAHQRGGSQDRNSRRDGDGLLLRAIASV